MKYYYVRNDLIFKAIFGDERNSEIIKEFLMVSADLQTNDLERIEILDPQTRIEFAGGKLSILDLKCTTSTGKIIGIELQVARDLNIRERLIFQNAKNFSNQLVEGNNYDKLKKAITIIISVDHIIISEANNFQYSFKLYDKENKVLFSDKNEIRVLEIMNMPKGKSNVLLDWLKFISATTEEELKMFETTGSSALQKAVVVLRKLNASEKIRSEAEMRERDIAFYESNMVAHKEEGKKEGRIEGKKEEKNAIAKNFLNLGLSLEQISKGTGLSISEIKKLK